MPPVKKDRFWIHGLAAGATAGVLAGVLAIVTFLAALTGAYFFAILQPKLPY